MTEMNKRSLLLCFVVSIQVCYVFCKSEEECLQLGFNKQNITCVVCNHLDTYGLTELKTDCLNCCKPSEYERKLKKYPAARLEICTCKFGAYPQIQAFCQGEQARKFPNLDIRYLRGAHPVIKLLDESQNVMEVLAIDKWNTDTINEFFTLVLETSHDSDYLQTNAI